MNVQGQQRVSSIFGPRLFRKLIAVPLSPRLKVLDALLQFDRLDRFNKIGDQC